MNNICKKDHNKKTKKYLLTCAGCNKKRMAHYGDWCDCSNPEFALTSANNLDIKIPKGLGRLLI